MIIQETLVVPNIKNAQDLDFLSFFNTYNRLVKKAHEAKLDPSDFMGTTVTLTNPGGIGRSYLISDS